MEALWDERRFLNDSVRSATHVGAAIVIINTRYPGTFVVISAEPIELLHSSLHFTINFTHANVVIVINSVSAIIMYFRSKKKLQVDRVICVQAK